MKAIRQRLQPCSTVVPRPDASDPAADSASSRELADESGFHLLQLGAPTGLRIKVLPLGSIYAIEFGDVLINQVLPSPIFGGLHTIYLRVHAAGSIQFAAIVGAAAVSEFSAASDRLVWRGHWQEVSYRCTCRLHPRGDGWFFQVEVQNHGSSPARCDAVLVQDLGLATRAQVRNNELFNSHYLDHVVMQHPELGHVLMSRQNLPQPGGKHPWLLQGCLPGARGFVTDGLDLFGTKHRGDGIPSALLRPMIGAHVRQGEIAYTAIQSSEAALHPSQSCTWTFFAHVLADHPDRSSENDLQRIALVKQPTPQLDQSGGVSTKLLPISAPRSIFQNCQTFVCDGLSQAEVDALFPSPRRNEEIAHGRLISFFYGPDTRHVVLKAKELSVTRPHGHIMRSGRGMTPLADLMSCTCYASGVFMSQVAFKNSGLCKFLTSVRDPLNLLRSGGLRIFVRQSPSEPWQLLAVPSAFEMAPDCCRWYYRRKHDTVLVSCVSCGDDPAFTLQVQIEGEPLQLLSCGEIAAGPAEFETRPRMSVDASRRRITIRPDSNSLLGKALPKLRLHLVTATPQVVDALGGDELLLEDGQSRGYPYFAIRTLPTNSFTFSMLAVNADDDSDDTLCTRFESRDSSMAAAATPSAFWRDMTCDLHVHLPDRRRTHELGDTLQWFAHNAVVHLSVPRGLEQPNGGGWGIRDVCQGPIEFLLSYDHAQVAADVLRQVFTQQYERRADWPQWFMLPPFESIQSPNCHGDILIWPLKALCDYLEHCNDAALLRERVAYTDDRTFQLSDRRETILEHVDRLLMRLEEQFLPGLALPRYGEGDWDDSLQPADPALRERLVSSWTCELIYQTLRRFAGAMTQYGDAQRAARAQGIAAQIESNFRQFMMPDGIVAGFTLFDGNPPRPIEYLLHPRDTRTGLRYRLIPMTRGILSEIFDRAEAMRHLELIQRHLLFPDGARLMDRPTRYNGGLERTFRRSESAAFFGREIGLQYVHAHLRYAEALSALGRADELWQALLVVNPIAVTELLENAAIRQRNCYFSSSDAAFRDRYEAWHDYEKLRQGRLSVEAGWRIYSSGPGLYTNLVIRRLFGLRKYFEWMEFDPVLPMELDGAVCELTQFGKCMRYEFNVRGGNCSPRRVSINGQTVASLVRVPHPYRDGGVRIKKAEFQSLLREGENVVRIEM